MKEDLPLTIVACNVSGVAPTDRNFFGGTIQRHLEKVAQIDLRIDWSGGDSGTKNVKVLIDADLERASQIGSAIRAALTGTYLAGPHVERKTPIAQAA